MACGTSQNSCLPCSDDDASCVQAQPVLPPAKCSDDANTKAEGPPGLQGETGATPAFTVGTVTEGDANVILTENTPIDYTVDFVIPQPPIDTANTWTAVQTYDLQAIFQEGLETTGGTSTFGGTAFTVTPDASFGGDISVGGDATIAGSITAQGNEDIAGDLTVGSAATLEDLQINGDLTFGTGGTITLALEAGEIKGLVIIDSCDKPKLAANVGAGYLTRHDGTALSTVTAGFENGICDAFTFSTPVSSCVPQITPIVLVQARISYNFGSVPSGNFIASLRVGSVVGSVIDQVVQGRNSFDNANAGCIMLEAQVTCLVGVTQFFVSVDNNTDQDFHTAQVTLWTTY